MNSKVVTTILVITVTVSGIFGQEASSAVSSSSSLSSNAAPVAPKMSPAQLAMMRSAMTRRAQSAQQRPRQNPFIKMMLMRQLLSGEMEGGPLMTMMLMRGLGLF